MLFEFLLNMMYLRKYIISMGHPHVAGWVEAEENHIHTGRFQINHRTACFGNVYQIVTSN